ncbi:branch point binding protein [Strigomonas culicis]|uniref:Branchpoint-bridging protein n=1 Tax=Strigomonas culicis TaxID=28005 RepID=S9VCC1_9TRYP|nr:branch point binding protein [Strigomonas culicis]|eukprot:EPY24616.1 branch point binding protein [Strigomonas culicis]
MAEENTSAKPTSRWSTNRYTNINFPSYIPSEALVCEQGQFLRAFLLRVLAFDLQRLIATNACADYFTNIPLQPEYDGKGNRTNTPENVIWDKRAGIIDELGRLLRTYVERSDANKKDILRKVYFTQEHMDAGAWGAILGARGSVHQQLEKDTRCKIVLAGRGITNTMKDTSPAAMAAAMEDPHIRITAANEEDLQAAVERLEWMLSDDPEAEALREKNRRRIAQVEGRYDPRTWGAKKANDAKPGEKRAREEPVEDVNQEVDDFLAGL